MEGPVAAELAFVIVDGGTRHEFAMTLAVDMHAVFVVGDTGMVTLQPIDATPLREGTGMAVEAPRLEVLSYLVRRDLTSGLPEIPLEGLAAARDRVAVHIEVVVPLFVPAKFVGSEIQLLDHERREVDGGHVGNDDDVLAVGPATVRRAARVDDLDGRLLLLGQPIIVGDLHHALESCTACGRSEPVDGLEGHPPLTRHIHETRREPLKETRATLDVGHILLAHDRLCSVGDWLIPHPHSMRDPGLAFRRNLDLGFKERAIILLF